LKLAPLLAALFCLSLVAGSAPVEAKRPLNSIPCGARDIPYWQYHPRTPGTAPLYRVDFEARGQGSFYFQVVPNAQSLLVSSPKAWQAHTMTVAARTDSPNPAGIQLVATAAACPSSGLEVRNVVVTAIP
jgi:hypothetical protein